MDITAFISHHGGVNRTADLVAAGFSRHVLGQALRSGRILRVAPGWVAAPNADPVLAAAARGGVVLSCLTQAERIGLWIPRAPDRPHVAARSPNAHVRSTSCTVHWAHPLVPREPHVLEDPLENVLGLVAACQPAEEALVVWD